MKKNGKHPPYQDVLFVDSSNGVRFVCGSAVQAKDREEFEGVSYPVVRLPTTAASHPFFTGAGTFADSEGRMERFGKRYAEADRKRKAQLEQQEALKAEKLLKTPAKKARKT